MFRHMLYYVVAREGTQKPDLSATYVTLCYMVCHMLWYWGGGGVYIMLYL